MTKRASALSVGQQQRVAVARALIGAPPILIADEPTSALDAGTQAAFLDVLFEQAEAQGTSVLMVSHDARLGERFDRTVAMEDLVSVPA
jgi:putative ABC transport system ATP-binding protein